MQTNTENKVEFEKISHERSVYCGLRCGLWENESADNPTEHSQTTSSEA